MHQGNKKIDRTFKLLAHASIKLYPKKEELLDTKCQISKHQQIIIIIIFELLSSCINKSTQFPFFGLNLQTLIKPKQKRKHNFIIVAFKP
jgi:hypothetical protein